MKQENTWLTYSKTILQKVSFDTVLFIKELNKAVNILSDEDVRKLEDWCIETFDLELSLIAVKPKEPKRLKG